MFSRSFTRSISLMLCAVVVLAFPVQSFGSITTLSTGMVVEQNYYSGGISETTFSEGGETLVVTHTGSQSEDTIVIDDELVLVFNWIVDSNGNPVLQSNGDPILDSSTFTFRGQSVTRYGYEKQTPRGPCHIDYGCPEPEVHPNAEAQMALLSYAFAELHSASFLQSVTDSSAYINAQSWGCAWAIAGHVGSWVSIAGCVTGIGCVGWLVLHAYSGYQVGRQCS